LALEETIMNERSQEACNQTGEMARVAAEKIHQLTGVTLRFTALTEDGSVLVSDPFVIRGQVFQLYIGADQVDFCWCKSWEDLILEAYRGHGPRELLNELLELLEALFGPEDTRVERFEFWSTKHLRKLRRAIFGSPQGKAGK